MHITGDLIRLEMRLLDARLRQRQINELE